jgi:periplasmic divalent cation tolerance protein
MRCADPPGPVKSARMMIAWTTVEKKEDAERMAAEAVRLGLAACVQIDGPIVSHFKWQGRNERSEEFRLCFKFAPAALAPLETWVLAHHPYENPEWIAVRAERAAEKYLSWAEANFTSRPF